MFTRARTASSRWLVAGAAFLAVAACASSATQTASEPLLQTSFGPVTGEREGSVNAFRGVRYGADTETTRFAAPADPAAWTEAQDATRYGAACPQPRGADGGPGGLFTSWQPDNPTFSEDCLFLNVWTPGIDDGGDRAIMVWLHGGGFTTGSGSSSGYDGARLAARGDVVVVTVNHRLNIFGYANLAHYGEGFEDSSVAGVLDMIQALEWVRDNAEAIGGDPDRVMIFGESGGGAKVSTLLSSPAAKGLFSRAVMQSGVLPVFPSISRSQELADKGVAAIGLDAESIADIRAKTTQDIQAAFGRTGAGSAPSLDGRILTEAPFAPKVAAARAGIPVMLGTNRTENSLFAGGVDPTLFDMDDNRLKTELAKQYPRSNADAIIAGYRAIDADLTAPDIFFEATTDSSYQAGHVAVAEALTKDATAPVYLYLFNYDTPVQGGKWRSPHALEIGFVFDNVALSESMGGVGEAQQQIADMMSETWIAFAKTGKPNNAAIPDWPAYTLGDRATMVFDLEPEVVNDARAAQRALFTEGPERYLNRYVR